MTWIDTIKSNKRFNRLMYNFFYMKLCYGRFSAYLDPIKNPIDDIIKYATLLAVLSLKYPYLDFGFNFYVFICVFYIVFRVIFGHYDLKLNMTQMEISLNNSYNPEISNINNKINTIHEVTKGDGNNNP